jgi:hypothetical protein
MVVFRDDGDIVRAVGLVAIHFADLESVVDKLINDLDQFIHVPGKVKGGFQFAAKIEFLEDNFLPLFGQYPASRFNAEDRDECVTALNNCSYCADERGNLLHSRVVADLRNDKILQLSGRRGEGEITSAQTYDLVQKIWATGGQALKMRFALGRLSEMMPVKP